MSWIAISGAGRHWTDDRVFNGADRPRDALMAKGSLLIETRLSAEARPQSLLSFERQHPWPGGLSLQALPNGSIVLVMSHGGEAFHTLLQYPQDARTDILRVTYSWDSTARRGQLALERPESDAIALRETPPPPPLLLEDLYSMVRRPQLCHIDPDVIFFAVSDAVEPVGPMPSLTGGCRSRRPKARARWPSCRAATRSGPAAARSCRCCSG